MSEFKIGDKIVVTKPEKYEDYSVGDTGIVIKVSQTSHKWVDVILDNFIYEMGVTCHTMYFEEIDHFKEIDIAIENTMNAEQIRDEILRIDVRIEEAKKDIENAEKERNSLVEKLREKGFEIVRVQPISKDIVSLDEVVIGDTYIVTNNFGEAEDRFVGEKVIVRNIDEYANTLFVYVDIEDGGASDWMHYRDLAKI